MGATRSRGKAPHGHAAQAPSSRSASRRSRCLFVRRWAAAARVHPATPEWPPRTHSKTHLAARCKTHRWLRFGSRLTEQSSLMDRDYSGLPHGTEHYKRRLPIHLPHIRSQQPASSTDDSVSSQHQICMCVWFSPARSRAFHHANVRTCLRPPKISLRG